MNDVCATPISCQPPTMPCAPPTTIHPSRLACRRSRACAPPAVWAFGVPTPAGYPGDGYRMVSTQAAPNGPGRCDAAILRGTEQRRGGSGWRSKRTPGRRILQADQSVHLHPGRRGNDCEHEGCRFPSLPRTRGPGAANEFSPTCTTLSGTGSKRLAASPPPGSRGGTRDQPSLAPTSFAPSTRARILAKAVSRAVETSSPNGENPQSSVHPSPSAPRRCAASRIRSQTSSPLSTRGLMGSVRRGRHRADSRRSRPADRSG